MEFNRSSFIKKINDTSITSDEIDLAIKSLDKTDLRKIVVDIYKQRQQFIDSQISLDKKIIIFLNRFARFIKNRKIKNNINNLRIKKSKNIILAEGDSWFEYPLFLIDLVDWIIQDDSFLVYSHAHGGDEIIKIMFEADYLAALKKYKPDIFLISGGGTDLVGEGRLANLVNLQSDFKTTEDDLILMNRIIEQNFANSEIDAVRRAEMIVKGTKYLSTHFYSLMISLEILYKLLFKNIETSETSSVLKIITHGYDFVIPSNNRNVFENPLRWIFGNGKWMYYPLYKKGIKDAHEQACILSAIIYHFNEMLIKVAAHANKNRINKQLGNLVYHIDCRAALLKSDWADELHPHSASFKKISDVYTLCINDIPSLDKDKSFIYPVRKYLN